MLKLRSPLVTLSLSGVLLGASPQLTFAHSAPIRAQRDLITQMQASTVRLLAEQSSGSGVIVRRQGSRYTVLTSWHVLAFSDRAILLTPDGRRHRLSSSVQRLGNADIASVEFYSHHNYAVAPINREPLQVNALTYAAGFPMYELGTLNTTFEQGIRAFQLTRGRVALVLPKSLTRGYRLGYTNDIVVGMSGGPIFNAQGEAIGINGRLKNRDPDFGVYTFEDGTTPNSALLEQILQVSWGVPVALYFP